jgi:hypothetical protein
MSQAGLEPTISAFERAKTVHALDHTATVIGPIWSTVPVRRAHKLTAIYEPIV